MNCVSTINNVVSVYLFMLLLQMKNAHLQVYILVALVIMHLYSLCLGKTSGRNHKRNTAVKHFMLTIGYY